MASTLVLVLVLVVVFDLDLIAFALAVAAEQRRSSNSFHWPAQTHSFSSSRLAKIERSAGSKYCVYDSDIATGLSVGSLLLLMASQVLIMAVSGCRCCGRALCPSRSRTQGVFGAGAAFIVFTGIFSKLFYARYSKANDGFLPQSQDAGIRMGSI